MKYLRCFCRQLEADLELERSQSNQQQIEDLQARLTTITDHYTSQIETLTSERSTLKMHLEDERNKSKLLQSELKEELKNTDAADPEDEWNVAVDLEGAVRGGVLKHRGRNRTPARIVPLFRRGEIQSQTVAQAVSVLDSFGAYLGTSYILYRSPTRFRTVQSTCSLLD